ncbi:hypothetical protein KP509_22G057500 [Ceratopteris richardii]|uniref:Toprim domain-containing protein n=1 Tax=Ceratopteris richardii TaxID=49495 RepID=A0A8T2S5I1_CERRI|nr:hypothetical protein KP509_22G057500 [Ceratopteris richardii]
MVKSSCGRTSSFYLSRSFVVSSMGYRSGNLAVHGGGASMSQIVHGVFLKRTLLLSAQIPTKRTLPTACLSSLSNAVTLSLHNGGALFLHTRTFMGLHLLKRGLLQDRDSTSWRFSGSMKTGSALSVRGDQGNSERSFSGGSRANNSVVVVESPSKAKTIEKYLGLGYTVLPTYGHIRDLAAQAGSVRPNDDYEMIWKVPEDAYTHINKIKDATTKAELLVLATDPDREGEAIAWHVSEVLKDVGVLEGSKPKVVRVTFNEITKNAVLHAMQNPRDICSTLVTAYLARRALDHLIGFGLSPVLWRKLPGSRSAGRVQSVALKLICDREKEREEFVQQEYWTVEAYAKLGQGQEETELFRIRPTHVDGNKIEKFSFGHADASSLSERLKNNQVKVVSVEMHHKRRNPPSPYITSTLQMDAQAKLGYGAIRTMTV